MKNSRLSLTATRGFQFELGDGDKLLGSIEADESNCSVRDRVQSHSRIER